MAGNYGDKVNAALDMLPAVGSEVEFDAYKAQLQAADPNNWRETFEFILKNNLVKKSVTRPPVGNPVQVMLSRKA